MIHFEFEGDSYRIEFRHERSRAWEDHHGHELELIRACRNKHKDHGEGHPHGPAVLVCMSCTALTGEVVRLSHFPKGERTRGTICRISVLRPKESGAGVEWVQLGSGRSKLNRKTGDRWTRAGGRVASLDVALGGDFNPEFKAAARLALANACKWAKAPDAKTRGGQKSA